MCYKQETLRLTTRECDNIYVTICVCISTVVLFIFLQCSLMSHDRMTTGYRNKLRGDHIDRTLSHTRLPVDHTDIVSQLRNWSFIHCLDLYIRHVTICSYSVSVSYFCCGNYFYFLNQVCLLQTSLPFTCYTISTRPVASLFYVWSAPIN